MIALRFWLYLIMIVGLLAGCRKEEAPAPAYVPGQLLVVMESGQTMDATVALFNASDLPLLELHGFLFRSPRPQEEVRRALAARPYLRPQRLALRTDSATGATLLLASFYDLSPAAQDDWRRTRTALALAEAAHTTTQKWVLVKVPERSEQRWIDLLARREGVKWAELNYKTELAN